MNLLGTWLEDLASEPKAVALRDPEHALTRGALRHRIDAETAKLCRLDQPLAGRLVGLCAEPRAETIVSLLALWSVGAVVALLQSDDDGEAARRLAAASEASQPQPLATLRATGRPGLVLFSSGTSGVPKAIVHDAATLLESYPCEAPRPGPMLAPMPLDHIGGLNTVLRGLARKTPIVLPRDRHPETIAADVERERIAILPASPSLLRLLLASDALARYDCSSLALVTYGSEKMDEATLAKLREALPHARLRQTYGMSEMGILAVKSESDDSLWMRLSKGSNEVRIVDGALEVRSPPSFLGYLNAPSPLTADGWYQTGDLVEIRDDGLFRVLGRRSAVINVAGQKVLAEEVEEVLRGMELVLDAVVVAEAHPLLGQIVAAKLVLKRASPLADVRRAVHAHCMGRIAAFKVPQRIEIAEDA